MIRRGPNRAASRAVSVSPSSRPIALNGRMYHGKRDDKSHSRSLRFRKDKPLRTPIVMRMGPIGRPCRSVQGWFTPVGVVIYAVMLPPTTPSMNR
jgi:hypothetical protein